jgi:hypothetical protein
MSGYTGLMFEELYSFRGAATTTSPSTSATSIIQGYPQITIPAGYFSKAGRAASSCKLWMRGNMTSTATLPTWKFGVGLTQAIPAAFGNTINVETPARTPGAAQTGPWWHIDVDFMLDTLALGAASKLFVAGTISSEGLMPSAFSSSTGPEWSFPAANTSAVTGASIDVDQPIFLWPYVTLGTATAGNTVTTQMAKLYGEN